MSVLYSSHLKFGLPNIKLYISYSGFIRNMTVLNDIVDILELLQYNFSSKFVFSIFKNTAVSKMYNKSI